MSFGSFGSASDKLTRHAAPKKIHSTWHSYVWQCVSIVHLKKWMLACWHPHWLPVNWQPIHIGCQLCWADQNKIMETQHDHNSFANSNAFTIRHGGGWTWVTQTSEGQEQVVEQCKFKENREKVSKAKEKQTGLVNMWSNKLGFGERRQGSTLNSKANGWWVKHKSSPQFLSHWIGSTLSGAN